MEKSDVVDPNDHNLIRMVLQSNQGVRKSAACVGVLSAVADGFGARNLAGYMVMHAAMSAEEQAKVRPKTCGLVLIDPWVHMHEAIVGQFSASCGTLWRLDRAGLVEDNLNATNISIYESEPEPVHEGNSIVL